ncbi:PREDICTED: UDP-glycosyltransferase 74E2-like [Ipomoea nil]|uniref:UDP-glycosyltransferase 74E2-like n=1 Tax=Ipomoea nil TaxID=35883 RepID=UPI0009015196|nr:PREDICTED: UDP-glycosyltransferase 74E2-like [Ipomoea nil]
MEEERGCRANVHVVVLAYHGQGHINPMVQFSKRLASKGIKITVATTLSNTKALQAVFGSGSLRFLSVYDDCTEGGVAGLGGFKGFLDRFQVSGSKNLSNFIAQQDRSEYPVKCLVYDANIPWASDIASHFKIASAAFFTQSCAAAASYYPMYCEVSGTPLPEYAFPLIGLPKLGIPHVPSLGPIDGRYPPIIMHLLRQFDNIHKANWVLMNSFDKLEEEVVEWMAKLWPVKPIGPTVPSFHLDKRVENDDDYGFHTYKLDSRACMEWLSNKKPGSVVYVSFGSVALLSAEQMSEIAASLKQSCANFLWVVKPTEQSKIPHNFIEETSSKGFIASWCPQLEVLAHDAVGCFVSHCGWNSTLEAICFGVPIVGMPQFLDQMINTHLVEKVWKVGMGAVADDKGFTRSEEISKCIQQVLEGEMSKEIKKNALRWKELAKEAIDEGGSSDKHINEIVSYLIQHEASN